MAFAGSFAAAQARSRLKTLLFNLPDDLAGDRANDLIDGLKGRLHAAGAAGFLMGRNMIPTPFPTRFEWICMVETDGEPALRQVQPICGELLAQCRNFVQCDLACSLPPGYMDAASVKVRHTVMFNFKPDASSDARERIVADIREMGKLPMVQSYLVEPIAAAASEPNQMQWQVIGDFASVADYRAYSAAPVHLAIRENFTAHTSRVAFLDVEL